MVVLRKSIIVGAISSLLVQTVFPFSLSSSDQHVSRRQRKNQRVTAALTATRLYVKSSSQDEDEHHHDSPTKKSAGSIAFPQLVASTLLAATMILTSVPLNVNADEYGVETEAPTLFTGENVMICKKRGPLGACLESVTRTEENDNDKAKKYFKPQTELIKEKEAEMRGGSNEGNALIEKLRQQSLDNKERNELDVQIKTFENDQSATFGPFDRQVLILNTDGKTFTLLTNPQAMRLKSSGFIEGRKFVKQPSEDEIEAALEASEAAQSSGGGGGGGFFGGIGGAIQGVLGGDGSD